MLLSSRLRLVSLSSRNLSSPPASAKVMLSLLPPPFTSLTLPPHPRLFSLAHSKSPSSDLWTFTVPSSAFTTSLPSAPHSALFILSSLPFAPFVSYLHRSFGYPSISTFTHAIARGFIHGIPTLTTSLVHKFPPPSLSSSYGHLDLLAPQRPLLHPSPNCLLHPQLCGLSLGLPPAIALASPPFPSALLLPPTAVRGIAPPSPSPARIGPPRTSPVVSLSLPVEDTSIYSLSSTGVTSMLSPCLPALRLPTSQPSDPPVVSSPLSPTPSLISF
jgi:hypothetical protein